MLLPILSINDSNQDMPPVFRKSWIPLFFYAAIFYLNYLYLINHFLFRKKYSIFFVLNLLVIVLFVLLNWRFNEMKPHFFLEGHIEGIRPHPPRGPHPPPPGFLFDLLKSLAYVFPVVLSIALKAMENRVNFEAEKKEVYQQHLESELQNLKYQLHPHFFFNSLNNIYSLIELSKSQAQAAVHDLSKLMRYLLNNNGDQKVELIDEINFLEKYIQLMNLRQSKLTTTKFNLPSESECVNLNIYPFLLMPIFENAYKHGVSSVNASIINFDLKIVDNVLYFECDNPLYSKKENDKSGSGIGLDNLSKRLNILYPKKHTVTVEVKDEVYKTTLIIEL